MTSENPQKISLPAIYEDRLSSFQKVMLMKVLREPKLLLASKVFVKKEIDHSSVEKLLRHACPWKQRQHDPPTFEVFEKLLSNTKNSAPGPDGVPYCFWRHLSDLVARHLYNSL